MLGVQNTCIYPIPICRVLGVFKIKNAGPFGHVVACGLVVRTAEGPGAALGRA